MGDGGLTKKIVCPNCKHEFEIEIWVNMHYTKIDCPNCQCKLAISNNWGKYEDLE